MSNCFSGSSAGDTNSSGNVVPGKTLSSKATYYPNCLNGHPTASGETLIFTDLLFNITRHDSAYGRFLLRLDGAFQGLAIPRSFRLLLRRRRSECTTFRNRLLSWDFDRVILAHGELIDSGAKPAVERAWQFT